MFTTATKSVRKRMSGAFTKSLGVIPSPSGRDYNKLVSSPSMANNQRRSSFSVFSKFFSRTAGTGPESGDPSASQSNSNTLRTPKDTPTSHFHSKFTNWDEPFDFAAHLPQGRDPQSESAQAGIETKRESALDRLRKEGQALQTSNSSQSNAEATRSPKWPVQWGDAAATEGWRSGMVEGAKAIQGHQHLQNSHDEGGLGTDTNSEDSASEQRGNIDGEAVGNKEGIGFVDQVGGQSATARYFQEREGDER